MIKKLVIVDYGLGNILSAEQSFRKVSRERNLKSEILITNINPKIERILQDLDFDKNVGVSNFHVSKKTIMPILEKRYDFLSRS